MSWLYWDQDMWEPVHESGPTYVSFGWRQRSPEEVALIKAERERKREDEILEEAERIKLRRDRGLWGGA